MGEINEILEIPSERLLRLAGYMDTLTNENRRLENEISESRRRRIARQFDYTRFRFRKNSSALNAEATSGEFDDEGPENRPIHDIESELQDVMQQLDHFRINRTRLESCLAGQ